MFSIDSPRLRAVVALLLLFTPFSFAQDGVREALFEEAKRALTAANEARAALLAPTSYADAAGHYKRAEDLLARGGSIDRIRSELAQATSAWRKALEATELARITLAPALEARQDAESADAANFASDAWTDGERLFAEAASRLETGSLRGAEREGEKARARYREAELAAIKANYLNETRALLERADDLRAERYAPATFLQATTLLEQAEDALNRDRYDTDRPRSLAQDAKHSAKLAIYLAENLSRIGRDRAELEAFLLSWQTPLKRVGATLDTPVWFDDGFEAPTQEVVERVEALLATARTQAQDLADLRARAADMETQIAALEERLGGASQERLALAAQLEAQARIRAKFASVEAMFDRDEAIVLRSGNDIILRMVGLTFDSGRADIKVQHIALLEQVERAIGQFAQAELVIEGHTDAFGSDETNLRLSTQRAEAVKDYVLKNMGLEEWQVKATGYGESRPIANNETREGREKNRRIDIVIRPSL